MKKCLLLVVLSTLALSACNTIQGAGEDLSNAGQDVSSAAKKVKDKIDQ